MRYKLIIFAALFLGSPVLYGQSDSIFSNLKFELDYRFRAEQDWSSKKSDGSYREDRSRLRYRLRTGATYTHNWYSIGVRIRTGDPNKQQDPQLTLGKGLKEFGTLPIGFEKAFFQYKSKKLTAWLGKNTYPFQKNNELFWSDNVYPEGVMLEKTVTFSNFWLSKLTLTGGHFIIASNNTSFADDAYFQGFQTSISSEKNKVTLFPSVYIFKNIPDIPDGGHSFLLDYTILHLGTKLKPWTDKNILIDFDYYQNIEDYEGESNVNPELSDQKTGYTLGIQYGKLKSKKDWLLKLTYANLERYSILDYMAQNDWARWDYSSSDSPDGRLSNLRGIEAVFAYAITKKVNFVTKYYNVGQLVPYGTEKETGQRIRFDINIKM